MKKVFLLGASLFLVGCVNNPQTNTFQQFLPLKKPEPVYEVYEEKTVNYEIEVEYPVIGNQIADDVMKSELDSLVKEYQKTFRAYDRDPNIEITMPYQFLVEVDTIENFKDIQSVKLSAYEFTGGAHGMPSFLVYVFHKDTGARLAFESVFADPQTALEEISVLVQIDLKKQLEVKQMFVDEFLNEGSVPIASNYRFWILEREGIRFFFPPYQVAPYSAGTLEVLVDWKDIKHLLNSEF